MRAAQFMMALVVVASVTAHQGDPPVMAEFRVFSGVEEITAHARLRVMPTGARDKATPLERGPHLTAALPPGIYDVQVLRLRKDAVVAIKWTERLVVMHYPDEGGRHLEVINFEPGFGALQLRAARGPVTAYEVGVFPSGVRTAAAGGPIGPGEGREGVPVDRKERTRSVPIDGQDYRLFILPAGTYDIRVRHGGGRADPRDTHWFLDVEVPADRTRLKRIDIGG